jgi:hypothetical protein
MELVFFDTYEALIPTAAISVPRMPSGTKKTFFAYLRHGFMPVIPSCYGW